MSDTTLDILVVGGGLTGIALTYALSSYQFKVRMIETKPLKAEIVDSDLDMRSLALSSSSQRILSQLQLWSSLQNFSCPINSIHVSEKGRFGSTLLEKTTSPLGYVVELHRLEEILLSKLDTQTIIAPATLVSLDPKEGTVCVETAKGLQTLRARVIVAADGRFSSVRQYVSLPVIEKNYAESALVTNIALERDHQNQALERFAPHGPLALLPMRNKHMALVWTAPKDICQNLQQLSQSSFLAELREMIGYRLGRLKYVGKRVIFPLTQSVMPSSVENNIAFIGNAAHTLHPVAGQGFNLSLRDIAMLVQVFVKYGVNAKALSEYGSLREGDQKAIVQFTNNLLALFAKRFPGAATFRQMGLFWMDNLPLVQHEFARFASGMSGIIPDLACNIPLKRGHHAVI